MAISGEPVQKWFQVDNLEVKRLLSEWQWICPYPSSSQCIGFGVPAVFAEGGTHETAYIADIYERVSFPRDFHRQIAELPDRSKVSLRVNPPKPAS